MILSFADRTTQDIYDGTESKHARKIPKALWPLVRRKLDALAYAHDALDLRAPPGNRLERLHGDLAGKWSIRVNDQYRVVFAFKGGNATDVLVTDYH